MAGRIRTLAGNRGNPATGRFPMPEAAVERLAGLLDCHRIALDFGADAARRALRRIPSPPRSSRREAEFPDGLLQGH